MEYGNIFFNTEAYEFGIKLGKGPTGEVYLAKNHEDSKLYAAKIFNIDHGFNGDQQMKFLHNSLIHNKLNHPSIIKFKGVNFQSNFDPTKLQPTLITEYLRNKSLGKILHEEKCGLSGLNWNPTKKYIILLGIADAMRCLHEHGILHCNLKPENILIDSNFYPHVCDFGLSQCFGTRYEMTKEIGTLQYKAPEIFIDGKYDSESSDVYSFAVIAYEIVNNRDYFCEKNECESKLTFAMQIVKGYRPTFDHYVNYKMKNLILKCLSNDPKERPSFAEIFDILSNDFHLLDEDVDEDEINLYIDSLKESSKEQDKPVVEVQRTEKKQSFNFLNYQNIFYFFLIFLLAFIFSQNLSNIGNTNASKSGNNISFVQTDYDLIHGFHSILGNAKELNSVYASNFFRKSSQKGNFYSSYLLGLLYENGKGVKQSFDEAMKFYKKSIQQGNVYGYHRLGLCYCEGYGVNLNFKEGIKYFQKGAELNISDSLFELGRYYEDGKEIDPNYTKAIEFYKLSMNLGNSRAICQLGLCYAEGKMFEKNYEKAIQYFTQASKLGNSFGYYNLAVCYEKGLGFEQNYQKAIDLYLKAADLGNPYAFNSLGSCYENGKGCIVKLSKAIKYYKSAAELGNELGFYNLGRCYEDGIGVNIDYKKAIENYKKASELGYKEAEKKINIIMLVKRFKV